MMMGPFVVFLLLVVSSLSILTSTSAFNLNTPSSSRPFLVKQSSPVATRLHAGFGGAAKKSTTTKKKAKKSKKVDKTSSTNLKAKKQWDRYLEMKMEARVRVAVRVVKGESQWLDVGTIRSKNDEYTEMALTRQKGLIADHSRRLFPLQVFAKDKVEWAYWKEDGEGAWVIAGNTTLEGAPADLDKLIGFEGHPDPATGYYCAYTGGRVTNMKTPAPDSTSPEETD